GGARPPRPQAAGFAARAQRDRPRELATIQTNPTETTSGCSARVPQMSNHPKHVSTSDTARQYGILLSPCMPCDSQRWGCALISTRVVEDKFQKIPGFTALGTVRNDVRVVRAAISLTA